MLKVLFPFFLFCFVINTCGQQDSVSFQDLKASESFWNITDTTIRNEIASFNRKGDSIKQQAAVKVVKLTEIPLISCSDTVANFHLKSAYIHLYFSDFDFTDHQLSYYAGKGLDSILLIDNQPFWGTNGKLPKREVTDVFFVLHSHYLVDFPDSAFVGIYEPWAVRLGISAYRKKCTSGAIGHAQPSIVEVRNKPSHVFIYAQWRRRKSV